MYYISLFKGRNRFHATFVFHTDHTRLCRAADAQQFCTVLARHVRRYPEIPKEIVHLCDEEAAEQYVRTENDGQDNGAGLKDRAEACCTEVHGQEGHPNHDKAVHCKADEPCLVEVLRNVPRAKGVVGGENEEDSVVAESEGEAYVRVLATLELSCPSAEGLPHRWLLHSEPYHRYDHLYRNQQKS